jgi:hypothetical protein
MKISTLNAQRSTLTKLMFFAFFSFLSSGILAQTTCPPPTLSGCNGPEETATLDVDISSYSGVACSMAVDITFCVDNLNPNNVTIKVTKWEIDWTSDGLSTACREALDKIFKAHINGSGSEYTLGIKDLYIHIGQEVLNTLAATLPDIPNCGSGGVINGHFYVGSCITNCFGNFKFGGTTAMIVVKGDCSSNICCFIDNKYCKEANGTVKKISSGMANVPLPGEACKSLNNLSLIEDCVSKGYSIKSQLYKKKVQWVKQEGCAPVCEVTIPKIAANNIPIKEQFIDIRTQAGGQDFNATVFPNPANEHISVFFEKEFTGEILLIDISGKVVFRQSFEKAMLSQLNTEAMESGIYAIQFSNNMGHISTEKIKIIR